MERIKQIYRFALARDPAEEELLAAAEFVDPATCLKLPGSKPTWPLDPWAQLAQVLLLCNEFAFVD